MKEKLNCNLAFEIYIKSNLFRREVFAFFITYPKLCSSVVSLDPIKLFAFQYHFVALNENVPDYDHRMHLFHVPYSQHDVQLYAPMLFYPILFFFGDIQLIRISIENVVTRLFSNRKFTWWSTKYSNLLNRSSMGISLCF